MPSLDREEPHPGKIVVTDSDGAPVRPPVPNVLAGFRMDAAA